MLQRGLRFGAEQWTLSGFGTLVLFVLGTSSAASAQPPTLEDSDAAELIGRAVQSTEGIEVGKVASVTMNSEGEVTEIRITVERWLGMGEKTVILPRDSYIALRGTIVVKLPLEDIRQLSSVEESARGH